MPPPCGAVLGDPEENIGFAAWNEASEGASTQRMLRPIGSNVEKSLPRNAKYEATPLVNAMCSPHMLHSRLFAATGNRGRRPVERSAMFTPERFRAKAAECGELAKTANSQNDAREFQRREASYTVLADNEQWLADHYEQTMHTIKVGGANETASAMIGEAAMAAEVSP